LAGELDWQGIGGKLSWNGLSRYFQYTNGGTGALKGDNYLGAASTVPGYKSTSYIGPYTYVYPNGTHIFYPGSDMEHINVRTGGPDVFCEGKKLCTIGAIPPYYIYVTCAAISPDKSKILIGYVKALGIGDNVLQYSEEFIILPKSTATGVIAASDPGVLKVVTIMGHEDVPPGTGLTAPGPEDPIYHPADSFTVEEASHLNGMVTLMWRINASASVGYSERRATRQRLDIVWDDDFENITVTPEEAAWDARILGLGSTEELTASGDIDNAITYTKFVPSVRSHVCKFCDFDWDTLVEGQITVEASEVLTSITSSSSSDDPDFVVVGAFTWTLIRSVSVRIAGTIRFETTSEVTDTSSRSGESQAWTRVRTVISENRTFFHWVDLRCDALSVDVYSLDPYVETTEANMFPPALRRGVLRNTTVIDGVHMLEVADEEIVVPTNTITTGAEEFPFDVSGPRNYGYRLPPAPGQPTIEFLRDSIPTKNRQILFGAGGKQWVPQALPYGAVLPFDSVTHAGAGVLVDYLRSYAGDGAWVMKGGGHYTHQSGLGVAETGIKVYYLSPTEKRCVWGIANLPSIHLNEVQTYTYGSDDPATAEQLKGVGADGLLLNIYVV
jgi:hypothetical protein